MYTFFYNFRKKGAFVWMAISNRDYYKILVRIAKKQGISRPFWNTTLFGVKLELKALPRYLSQGERIYSLVPCKYKGKKALAVVTDLRVLVLNRGLLGDFGNTQREDVYYNNVAGGNPHGSLISSYSISVPGTGNDFEIDGLWLGDAKTFDQTFSQARRDFLSVTKKEKNNPKPELKSEDDHSETIDQIRTILHLRQNDEITLEEFQELIEDVIN